jgi:hypothetical protein
MGPEREAKTNKKRSSPEGKMELEPFEVRGNFCPQSIFLIDCCIVDS